MLTKPPAGVQGHCEFTANIPALLSWHIKEHKQTMKGKFQGFLYIKAWFVWKLNLWVSGLPVNTNRWCLCIRKWAFFRILEEQKVCKTSTVSSIGRHWCGTREKQNRDAPGDTKFPSCQIQDIYFSQRNTHNVNLLWVGSKANSQKSIYCKCRQIIVIITKANVVSALYKLLKTYYQSMK